MTTIYEFIKYILIFIDELGFSNFSMKFALHQMTKIVSLVG